jgi:hypothetical protein
MALNKTIFSNGDMNRIGATCRETKLGNGLSVIPRTFQGTVTSHVLTLPTTAKAMALLNVVALEGTVDGIFTVVVKDSAPATTEAAITPTGDVIFQATDAVTSAEIVYVPVEGTWFQDNVVVSAAGAAILRSSRRAIQLLAASLDTGGGVAVPGAKTIVARADGAPSAGQARLEVNGLTVYFNGTDAGTGGTATITYLAAPGTTGADNSFGTLLHTDYPSYQ